MNITFDKQTEDALLGLMYEFLEKICTLISMNKIIEHSYVSHSNLRINIHTKKDQKFAIYFGSNITNINKPKILYGLDERCSDFQCVTPLIFHPDMDNDTIVEYIIKQVNELQSEITESEEYEDEYC